MPNEVKMNTFFCPMCKVEYAEPENNKECLVGGHWTPHSSDDKPPTNYPVTCCHQFQKKVFHATRVKSA